MAQQERRKNMIAVVNNSRGQASVDGITRYPVTLLHEPHTIDAEGLTSAYVGEDSSVDYTEAEISKMSEAAGKNRHYEHSEDGSVYMTSFGLNADLKQTERGQELDLDTMLTSPNDVGFDDQGRTGIQRSVEAADHNLVKHREANREAAQEEEAQAPVRDMLVVVDYANSFEDEEGRPRYQVDVMGHPDDPANERSKDLDATGLGRGNAFYASDDLSYIEAAAGNNVSSMAGTQKIAMSVKTRMRQTPKGSMVDLASLEPSEYSSSPDPFGRSAVDRAVVLEQGNLNPQPVMRPNTQRSGPSSQAGVYSFAGGLRESAASGSPAPGQPGSRFNPRVVERDDPRSRYNASTVERDDRGNTVNIENSVVTGHVTGSDRPRTNDLGSPVMRGFQAATEQPTHEEGSTLGAAARGFASGAGQQVRTTGPASGRGKPEGYTAGGAGPRNPDLVRTPDNPETTGLLKDVDLGRVAEAKAAEQEEPTHVRQARGLSETLRERYKRFPELRRMDGSDTKSTGPEAEGPQMQ